MNTRTKISLTILFVTACFFTNAVYASNLNFLGIENTNQTEGTSLTGATEDSKKGSFIPAKSGGKTINFTPTSQQVKHLLPTGKAQFCPHKDTANFINFTSANIVRDRIVRSNQINGGTCFGVSYFTSIYYSRMIRPVQQGKDITLFRQYDFDFGIWDGLTKDLSKAGSAPCDGVEYLVYETSKKTPNRFGRPFWNNQNVKEHLDDYRLRKMSATYDKEIKVGAISHHLDQQTCDRAYFDATDGDELANNMDEIKKRIEKHGTQMFFWNHYNLSNKWYSWDKREWGHACLFYRVSEVEVKGSNGTNRKAVKFHVYDPNTNYASAANKDTGEGYGDYMLYFPDSKQITFSQRMKSRYGMQTISSTVDNRQEKLGYYDIYEGHPVQTKIAKDAFCRAYTGLGRVLTDDEAQRAERDRKIRLENSWSPID